MKIVTACTVAALAKGGKVLYTGQSAKSAKSHFKPVPDLHYSTKMGMLFELKVGTGRLMVCGLNLSDESRPEVRTMRASVLGYMASDAFDPKTEVGVDWLNGVFAP